jgi:hypothetical protein
VSENRVLRTLFGPWEEIIGDWRRLHNEELQNSHASANITRAMKLTMRWTGNVARIEKMSV